MFSMEQTKHIYITRTMRPVVSFIGSGIYAFFWCNIKSYRGVFPLLPRLNIGRALDLNFSTVFILKIFVIPFNTKLANNTQGVCNQELCEYSTCYIVH